MNADIADLLCGTGKPIPTTPRGTNRRGGGGDGVSGPLLAELKTEVVNLHGVIAEMAEREEKLLRMLQLPDAKPDPQPIKRGDFVRRNRALVRSSIHTTSLFCDDCLTLAVHYYLVIGSPCFILQLVATTTAQGSARPRQS